jgi:uncharacterized SAM-dependent methyltransferase
METNPYLSVSNHLDLIGDCNGRHLVKHNQGHIVDDFHLRDLKMNGKVDEHLAADIKKRSISGAHWFRIAQYWFRICSGYNNPLNFGRVHSELQLIAEARDDIAEFIRHRGLVFLGVGIGDTECALIDIQLQRDRSADVVVLDVNSEFLQLFDRSLKMRQLENEGHSITQKLINGYFEDTRRADILATSNDGSNIALCMLGSTIGNYNDTGEILGVVESLTERDDLVVLGYQLDSHLEKVFMKYKDNGLFRDLIGNFLTYEMRQRISWKLDRPASTIEAWFDEIQLFRSRKFHDSLVGAIASGYNLESLKQWIDPYRNMCLHVLKRC